MSITIQPITNNDFEELITLFQAMADYQGQPEKMTNTLATMQREAEWLQGFTARNQAGELVGYATFFYAYYTWRGKCLYMDDLFIREDHRGQKIGRRLLEKVIDFARSEACHKVRWMVGTWNDPAIGLYEKMGVAFDRSEMACDLPLE